MHVFFVKLMKIDFFIYIMFYTLGIPNLYMFTVNMINAANS